MTPKFQSRKSHQENSPTQAEKMGQVLNCCHTSMRAWVWPLTSTRKAGCGGMHLLSELGRSKETPSVPDPAYWGELQVSLRDPFSKKERYMFLKEWSLASTSMSTSINALTWTHIHTKIVFCRKDVLSFINVKESATHLKIKQIKYLYTGKTLDIQNDNKITQLLTSKMQTILNKSRGCTRRQLPGDFELLPYSFLYCPIFDNYS